MATAATPATTGTAAPAGKSGAPKRNNAARLFGYDVFISFALGTPPRGTHSYASDLARRLRERDFTVFFSEDEASPGEQLDSTLLKALHRSHVLVVIANRGTLQEPRWVRQEVEQFRSRHPDRPIIPISIGGALQDATLAEETRQWLKFDDKIWLDESDDAVAQGIASDGLVTRLAMAPAGRSSNVKWRWVIRAVVAVLAVLTVAAIGFGFDARKQSREAQRQQGIAVARAKEAQEQRDAADQSASYAREQAYVGFTNQLEAKAQEGIAKENAVEAKKQEGIAKEQTATANRALEQARRNLAANYMTAAKSRLEAGFKDEAAALAAEALRNYDTNEARRLIVENPPLDLSHVVAYPPGSTFDFDVDLVRGRFATVGYQGAVRIATFDPPHASKTTTVGKTDLWSVRMTPDGSRLVIGDDKGGLHVLNAEDLKTAGCADEHRFEDRVDLLRFRKGGHNLFLRVEPSSIYSITYENGCPRGAPHIVYRALKEEFISDYVIDEANDRLIVTTSRGLVGVNLSKEKDNEPQFHQLSPAPVRIALQPRTNLLCVWALGGEELIFLDRDFNLTEPLRIRPFGSRGHPSRMGVFEFDSTGDRLIITDENGMGFVWSFPDKRLERVLRIHASLALLTQNELVTFGYERHRGSDIFRIIELDPPSRRRISVERFGAGDAIASVENSPAGMSMLMGTREGRVISLNINDLSLSEIAKTDHAIQWLGRSRSTDSFAYFGNGQITVMRQGSPTRQQSFLKESATGLYSAAWLDDGTAVAVGGGWTKPIILPADPARAPLYGPQVVNGTIDMVVSGPKAQVLLGDRTFGPIFNWDTGQNTMKKTDVLAKDVHRWGSQGVAALTVGGLFLRKWSSEGGWDNHLNCQSVAIGSLSA